MKKQKREYPEAFKEQAISLLRSSDRSAADIDTMGSWVLRLDCYPGGPPESENRMRVIAPRVNRQLADEPLEERVKQLERENARLRQEQEIL